MDAYYEIPKGNTQQQFVDFFAAICRNTLKKSLKSVSVSENNLKFFTVASTKDSLSIPQK